MLSRLLKPVYLLAAFVSLNTLFSSCRSDKGPDVSGISVELETQRFEHDLFAVDTTDLRSSLASLYDKYPAFFGDFCEHILGIPPIVRSNGERTLEAIGQFLRDYRPVYDSVRHVFPDLKKQEEEVIRGLQHVKYYFPNYPLPSRLISFIGPMDAYFEGSTGGYGDAITSEALAVGLQLHLGSGFSMYHSEMGLALYPAYISRKFAPEYISVNCLKNVVDDLYPDESADKSLIEQMVEKGKRLYLLDRLMPFIPDTLKIGYTARQLQGCYDNEGLIWNYFLRNGLVYNNDPSMIKNYVGDSPNTPEFGDGAPGNIGLFVGWQIVKKYMDEQDDAVQSIDQLMQTAPKEIFELSKYRPK